MMDELPDYDFDDFDDGDPGDDPTATDDAVDLLGLSYVEPSGWTWGFPDAGLEPFALSDSAEIVGEPAADMEHWHPQAYPDTCAIVAQEYILDELTGHDHSEDELVREATSRGFYHPGGGTPMAEVGSLLEAHGIGVERYAQASLDDIRAQLRDGNKVIVGVDGDELRTAGIDPLRDDWLEDLGAFPGQDANHAVQVIGIDDSDPASPKVILNDPGGPDGRGMTLPADKFVDAWQDSDRYLVHTTGQPPEAAPWAPSWTVLAGHEATLAGYYNADGTYHWTADNTDRDPETGAVVRRY